MADPTEKRAVVAGGGSVAIDLHLPRIRKQLGIASIRIVENDPRRRAELRRRFRRDRGVEVSGAVGRGEAYALAVIATPPKFHFDYYQELEDRAERILIEKPMTISAAKARQLRDRARARDKKVFVNLVRRTLDGYALLREIYREGRFGRLLRVTVAEGGIFSWNAVSLGSFSKELSGGGVLMDTGPHTLDLLLRVFDGLELEAAWTDASGHGIEANATLELSADGAVPVTLVLSRNRVLSNSAVFEFERATCRLCVRGNAIDVKPSRGLEYRIAPAGLSDLRPPAIGALFDAFYRRYLVADDPGGVGPAESVEVIQLIETAYASARRMRVEF